MPAARLCLCGRIVHGRCVVCDRARLARKRARRPYPQAERNRRAAAVAQHRAVFGDWCPGWRRPAHPSGDLTADHVVAVAAGGPEDGELEVLCRSCNAAKGAAGP